jgi:hypothetical protein
MQTPWQRLRRFVTAVARHRRPAADIMSNKLEFINLGLRRYFRSQPLFQAAKAAAPQFGGTQNSIHLMLRLP